MIELQLVGVRVELPSNQPIVLLKETTGDRYLPIWIGQPEAIAISYGYQGIETPRPFTHDLIRNILAAVGASVERIVITEIKDQIYISEIQLVTNGTKTRISSRPSDAIALATRLGVGIFCEESVLEEAKIVVRDDEEQEVEKFREFLEQVSPEDFK